MAYYRADQVGSLLRPPELLEARQAYQAGSLGRDALRRVEDRAIAEALNMQRQVGIEVYTDGEMRRDAWMSDVADAVEGFVDDHHIIHWHKPDGSTEDEPSRARAAAATLRQVRRLTAHEVAFLQQYAPGPFKITLPSPVSISHSGYKPGLSDTAYPTRAQFLEDLVRIIRGEMQALVAEGVAYIQLDEGFTGYVGEGWRTRLRQQGIDPGQALEADITAENACYDALPREQVTLAMHLCRGNSKSRWSRSGGYDWLAEQVFTSLHVDRFLLEYDSERSGSFAPLRFVPKGKIIVLGLVSTKHSQLEKQDDLLRRIEEAAQYVPYEQLALSPQCGFASVAEGNLLSPDEQRRKLGLVAETAQNVWG